MDFTLTKEQAEVVECIRQFGEAHFSHEAIRRWRKEQGLPDEVVQAFVNLDFGPATLVSDRAGSASKLFTLVLIVEELARSAGASLPFQTDLLNLSILSECATPELLAYIREDYQRTGRLVFSLAMSEPEAGSDNRAMRTTVKTVDDKLILNGRKTFVNNGEYAPSILVAALDGDATTMGKHPAMSLWLIPCTLEGVRTYPIEKTAQKMLPFSDIVFDNVEIDRRHFVTGGERGLPNLLRFFELGRCITCASSLGMAQAAMEDAVKRASERTAFGSSISRFQQIEQMLTDMEVKLTAMRGMVYRAALSIDSKDESTRLNVALMKRYVPKTAVEVASDAIQIFGGLGYTENARVFSIWEDCRGNQISEGTDEIMVRIAAPLLMEKYVPRKQ